MEAIMSKTYDFLKECGTFFVATVNGSAPAARPFGAVMELGGALYLSTANTKAVYAQLTKNGQIQIVAMKAGTGDWIRIDGRAIEVYDVNVKQAMLDACPALNHHFQSKDCARFALFKVAEMEAFLYANHEVIQLDP